MNRLAEITVRMAILPNIEFEFSAVNGIKIPLTFPVGTRKNTKIIMKTEKLKRNKLILHKNQDWRYHYIQFQTIQ